MVENDSFFKSMPEDLLYEFLCRHFEDVRRQYAIGFWPIDFYVRDIDTFFQLDGVYFHAIGVSEDELRASVIPKDKQRLRKKISDRRQNTYFKNRNLSLLRITDKEILSCFSDEEVISKLTLISGTNRIKDLFLI
jgi:very-short-patch-repair endonuclease